MRRVMHQIRNERTRQGLSQRVFGERCGFAQPAVAAYESGSREPGSAVLERLASGLGARVDVVPGIDVAALRAAAPLLNRTALLSLALHHEVAAIALRRPDDVRAVAARNLVTLRRVDANGSARLWLDEWERLRHGPLPALIAALIDPSSDGVDRRQCAPFAGVIDRDVRNQIIRALRADRADRRGTGRGGDRAA